MIRSIVLSSLAGALVIFAQAGLFFGVLFADFFARQLPTDLAGIRRAEPDLLLLFVADLLYALMLAGLFWWVGKVRTFRQGAVAGMLIGLAVVVHFDLIYRATTDLITPAGMAANAAISAVMSGIGGGVIAAVLGRVARA
jgi:hypothetical protein